MIELIFDSKGFVNIIDIGGTMQYWNIISKEYLSSHNVSITIINLPGSNMTKDQDAFTFIEGDACNITCFEDRSFDIAHSNSVVEHVGDWARMVKFAEELKKVFQVLFFAKHQISGFQLSLIA